MSDGAIARVLLDSPLPQLDRLFDYRIPEAMASTATPGVRVIVPLRAGARQARGYIVECVAAGDYEGTLSEVLEVVSEAPVLAPEVYRLIRRAADRAAGTASDLVRLAVPTRQVRVEKAWLARRDDNGCTGSALDDASREFLTGLPVPGIAEEHLSALLDAEAPLTRRRIAMTARPALVPLDGDQSSNDSENWVPAGLLDLVHLAARTLAAGLSTIISVPDHRDLDALQRACVGVIPADSLARVDAGQANADRYRGFLRALEPRPAVILGTRTAVLAPAHRLGLLALWDDGDPLHAEQHAPGVHSRDLALLRHDDTGCALVIAGHARSVEVERLVELGYLGQWTRPTRDRRRITPTAHTTGGDGPAASARIPSAAWRVASEALRSGPVLIQVARPGFDPRLACRECGSSVRCRACSGPVGVRRAGAAPSCHWCGVPAVDWVCPHCDSTRWRPVGTGSQRTAEELGRAFPGARVIVSDGDHRHLHVPGGRTLVIATRGAEPIVAGGYRAVLLLDGERMLARESLRVVEDCVRWWSNAAALAAPDAPVLLVGVGGTVATAMATGAPERIAADELSDRRALRFPPAVRVAVVTGTTAEVSSALAEVPAVTGIDILGPVQRADGSVRAIVRFDYSHGQELATRLRAALIAAATRRPARADRTPRRTSTLRIRFDDSEPFDLAEPSSGDVG